MSLLHHLKTRKPYHEFNYINGHYEVNIYYTYLDDRADIDRATIQADDSEIKVNISQNQFAKIAQHYRTELARNAERNIQRQREQMNGVNS